MIDGMQQQSKKSTSKDNTKILKPVSYGFFYVTRPENNPCNSGERDRPARIIPTGPSPKDKKKGRLEKRPRITNQTKTILLQTPLASLIPLVPLTSSNILDPNQSTSIVE